MFASQRQGKLAVPNPAMTPEDYIRGCRVNTPFSNEAPSESEPECPSPAQQCKSENPPPTLTSCLVTATVQKYTFQASDLFDIENWITSFCEHSSSFRSWSWSWNGQRGTTEMTEWLCQKGVEVDGEVRVFLKEGTLKICIGDVLVMVAEGKKRSSL